MKAREKTRQEQPLGAGVGDAFALTRLHVPRRATKREQADRKVREITWAAFGVMAKELAAKVAEAYQPDLVVGVAKGGIFVGGAVAAALGVDFQPVRVERRSRDHDGAARVPAGRLHDVTGKRILVVDDVANSGSTLKIARELARKQGARETEAAVLVVRPSGHHPDHWVVETTELVVFPWDLQLDDGGAGALDPGEIGV